MIRYMMHIYDFVFIFGIVLCISDYSFSRFVNENIKSSNCGYQSCHPTKEGYVNVHLIPHSHDDVGWVKTVDQFFYGTKSYIYNAGVLRIYDNVLKSVQKSKDRRFIYVETAFFWKWWQEQAESERQALREMVNNGQIEFTGGGWSMNDEAVTNYQSIIDQMTWGLRKLNDSFGECGRPKMGWQIDPFGHSNEMASIFAQLGYDGVILGRIDFDDKQNRLANKSMEMVWRGSSNLGRKTDIFTSVLYNHYDAPAGFCFDILCSDDPLVDDIYSAEYNIEDRAEEFIIDHVQSSLDSFQTNNMMVPMGRDFAYQEAETWFNSIDKLIKYVNNKEIFNGTKYHLLYSTPSCYAAAVRTETEGILSSPLKVDDFLPYGTDPHAYWTGFYTSRPTLKRYERMGNNFLQICKQLSALTNMSREYEPKLNSLREAMGVMQHHDAVTGTEKEQVAYDYTKILHTGITNCENITYQALSLLTNTNADNFKTCLLTNVSQCALTEKSDVFVVTIYNPLSNKVNKYVRLPVLGTSYSVTDSDGRPVKNQLVPVASAVKKIFGRESNATLELVFEAKNLPPLGFRSFFVKSRTGNDVIDEDLSLNFHYFNQKGVGFSIDPSTGLVNQIQMNNIDMDIAQSFWYYNGSNGWMDFTSKASGAYIFRPDEFYPLAKISDTAKFEVYNGDLVTEVHQIFNDYVSQVVRIYENEEFMEFDWLVGPVDIGDGSNGKEVISRYSTPLKSDATFYTDSNGREMVRRTRDFRPTWDITVNETESSNYYPITSKIAIRDEDENLELAILTDRAEGGSSLENGDVELMLMRTTVTDDQLGVGEALIEMAFDNPIIARGTHYLTLGHIKNTSESEQTVAALEHDIASRKLLDSWTFLSVPTENSFGEYQASHLMQFSGLTNSLPKNVRIMTLEPWIQTSYLLRLEHTFEKSQDPVLSLPVTVNLEHAVDLFRSFFLSNDNATSSISLRMPAGPVNVVSPKCKGELVDPQGSHQKDLFATFAIKSLRETTLGGNQWLVDNDRLKFKSGFQSDGLEYDSSEEHPKGLSNNNYNVHLGPMEIRTFIIEVEPKPY